MICLGLIFNKLLYCFSKLTISYTFPPAKHKDPGFFVSSDLVGHFGNINPAWCIVAPDYDLNIYFSNDNLYWPPFQYLLAICAFFGKIIIQMYIFKLGCLC